MTNDKVYLGDGLYARYDGFHLILTAEDGITVSNVVYLDPEVWQELLRVMGKWTAGGGQP
jgi:hypothetical protein